MIERVISWKEQLEMMEYVGSTCGISDYEGVRESMSLLFDEQYRKKPADLFTYEPIPDEEVRLFKEWLAEEE